MALRSRTKLTSENVLVRFYNYSDPNMGWGDEGTKMYATLPLSAFSLEERDFGKNGKTYAYTLTDEWYTKLEAMFGKYWHMSLGYELGDEDKRYNEIKEAKAMLKAVETIETL
jgi:hypothetical protein